MNISEATAAAHLLRLLDGERVVENDVADAAVFLAGRVHLALNAGPIVSADSVRYRARQLGAVAKP